MLLPPVDEVGIYAKFIILNLLKTMKKLLNVTTGILSAVLLLSVFATSAGTAEAYVHAVTLRIGSSGPKVIELQIALNASGVVTPALVTDGKFGPKTHAAVRAFQVSKGLVADGIVGPRTGAALQVIIIGGANLPPGCTSTIGFSPITGARCDSGGGTFPPGCTSASGFSTTTGQPCSGGANLPAGCTSTSGYSPTTGVKCDSNVSPGGDDDDDGGPLRGGAGAITITASGSYSSEKVGEGDKDVKVMAVDIEADDNSDVELQSTRVEFIQDTAGDPKQIWKYASEVSVWLDGKKVGSMDADDFSKSGNYYSATIPLENAIIRMGEKEELAFAVTANTSLESTDIDTDVWNADLINVRFKDADGVVITEAADAAGTAGGTFNKTFDFASFASATGATLQVVLEDEAINDVRVLDVDDTLDTSHPVTSISMKATGSDIFVDEVTATITTTGETDESVIVISSWIEVDGTRISEKEDVPAGGAVTYNDLDHTIEAGDTEEWVFWVELQDINGALDNADTVQLTVNTSGIVAEDESGDTITATGSNPVGGTHVVYDNSIRLTGFTQKAESFTVDGANNDRVELTLTFDVFNFGETNLYIPNIDTLTGVSTSATTTPPTTSEGVGYHIQSAGTVTPGTNDISAILSESDPDLVQKTNSFELAPGKTGTLTLKVTVATDGNPSIDNVAFRALLSGINWATSDTATGAAVYTANLTDYKTDYATLAD